MRSSQGVCEEFGSWQSYAELQGGSQDEYAEAEDFY